MFNIQEAGWLLVRPVVVIVLYFNPSATLEEGYFC